MTTIEVAPAPADRVPAVPSPTTTADVGRSSVWWLSPVNVTLVMVPLIVLATALTGDSTFRDLWRSPKTVSLSSLALLLAGALALVLGAALVAAARPVRARAGRWPGFTPTELVVLRRASTVLVTLTVLGYLAFLVVGFRSGISLAQLKSTFGDQGLAGGPIKKTLGTVAGVTTATEFGIPSVVVSALLLAHSWSRAQLVRILVVLGLSVPRAFLLTERLAILELLVPMVVIFAMRFASSTRGRRVVAALPLLAAPFVAVIFGAFEYFRSWVYFRETSSTPYVEWALQRLGGYYITALNNGALEMAYNTFPGRWPFTTWGAFWNAPGVAQLDLYSKLNGGDYDSGARFKEILQTYGNPEFRNSSGLAQGFVDYGTVGGVVFLFIAGLVLGLLYRSLRESRPVGMLAYPAAFIGLVELPRLMYWTQGRLIPMIVTVVVLALLLRRSASRQNS